METARDRAIIHVDMDAFYASVEQHDNPEMAGQPVIVGGLGARGVVAAASYEARKFGVFSAMPMVRARRLCPGGVYVRPRLSRYREVSVRVFELFRELTPQVEGLSLDEAFLDVTGSIKLFGDIEAIGRSIRDRIRKETGLQASVGMAHNKFLAKLASDFKKPAGFYHVDRAAVSAFLDPLPIGRLWGIGKKTEPRLKAIGVLTIGQLRKAQEESLRAVLGHRTGHFRALACGQDEREVSSSSEDHSISHEMTFDTDVLDARALQSELQRLSEAVMRRVRAQHLCARTIQIKIRDHHFVSVTRSRSIRTATASTQTCFKVAKGLLESWLDSHANTPVRLIGVGVSGFEAAELQAGPLDRTADAIALRYGPDKITHARAMRKKVTSG